MDAQPAEIVANCYRAPDSRKNSLPLAVRVSCGKGIAVVCPGPLASSYAIAGSPILRGAGREILASLHRPMVRLEGDYPEVEVVVRRKNGEMLVHLIHTAGAPVTGAFRHLGVVPNTGPVRFKMQLGSKPSRVVLEPEGKVLKGEYFDGEWRGELPDLHIHAILRVAGIA